LVIEVQDTQLEIGTAVCANATEVANELRELRFQAGAAAAAEDLEILSAGVHPFSGWEDQRLSDEERPRMLAGLFGQVLRQQHICGLHIHVQIPERYDRIRLMNVVRLYAPHFLALACSSPLYLGTDSGFASFRSIAWRSYPFSRVPPRFESADEFNRFIAMLIRNGAIPDAKTVYWTAPASGIMI
jgi:carboxylate-amine ligase